MIIRAAAQKDIGELVELGKLMHAESAMAFLPFETEKVAGYLRNLISNERNCLFVAASGNRVVGAIGGFTTSYFFCSASLAVDTGLFVRAEHRGSSAAIRLIRAFVDWATQRGASEVCLSVSTGVEIEKSHGLFVGMGMSHVGGVYKLRVSDGTPRIAK